MSNTRYLHPLRSVFVGLALASFTSGLAPVQAGEVFINNSTFDNLNPSPAWYWENWSRPGSTVTYDSTRNAAGGAVGSGSLRLSAPFDPANTGWQEAVFTLDTTDFDPSLLFSLSFDVKVDPSSTPRAGGDYGNIQFILRNGNNWDWRQQTFVPLTSTEWRRVTVLLAIGEQPINDVRAITVRIAQNAMLGPVTVNIDNIAFTEEVTIDNFDDGNIDGWAQQWGTTPDLSYDTLDRYGRQTSGSLRVAAPYFDPNITTWQQAVITIPFPEPVDASALYTRFNVDIKVDPGSSLTRGNNYGYFEFKRQDGAFIGTGINLVGTDWTNLTFDISPSIGTLTALIIQLGNNDFTGPVTYNLDNVSFTKRLAPPPPPTLSIEKAQGGLNLVHTSSDQYGRHNIYSADSSGLGFYQIPQIASVSYSFTLLSFPSAASNPGFQAHMFLVPGSPGSETTPDWNEPNVIFLDVRAGANGAGNCTFRWKTNQANGNGQLYRGGLPGVNSVSVLGTWTLHTSNNNQMVLVAPDSTTTVADFPADAAAVFSGPIRVYVGVQGNSLANVGQRARIGGVRVTSLSVFEDETVLLEDSFNGTELDQAKWVINSSAGGVQFLTPDQAGWIVSWSLPDTGFRLQWIGELPLEPDLAWNDSTAIPVQLGPSLRQANVPRTEVPADKAFFRLFNPGQ
jgi:hypothetical protein